MHTVTFQYEPLTWPASHSTKSGSLPQSPSMLPSLCSRTVCDLDVLAGSRPAPPRSSSNPPQLHPRTPRVSSSLPCCPRPQQSFFFFFFPSSLFFWAALMDNHWRWTSKRKVCFATLLLLLTTLCSDVERAISPLLFKDMGHDCSLFPSSMWAFLLSLVGEVLQGSPKLLEWSNHVLGWNIRTQTLPGKVQRVKRTSLWILNIIAGKVTVCHMRVLLCLTGPHSASRSWGLHRDTGVLYYQQRLCVWQFLCKPNFYKLFYVLGVLGEFII